MAETLILNRYRVIEEAGSGGFGTVYVAWDKRIQRKVAIKCIALSDADIGLLDADDLAEDVAGEDEPATTPGLDEARTAAMLADANIVTVYDFEVQGATAYLIMEYVEGATLTQFLERFDDQLSIDIVTAIIDDVAHALEVAHDAGVLHLDIKPDNILIDRQGHVKVTDFGLATLADAQGFGTASAGTIGYMPLEQMRQESLDARCDQWALASIAYEMICGENPFLAPTLKRAESIVKDAELVLPSLCWDQIDPAVDDVLFFALDPDREERYESVAEFADELLPLLGDANQGRKELASLMGTTQPDSAEDGADGKTPRQPGRIRTAIGGLFDGERSVSSTQRTVAAHIFGVVGTAVVGITALKNIPGASGMGDGLFWGMLGIMLVAAAIRPHLGAALSFLALAASLFFLGCPLGGLALVAATALWWFFIGRKGRAHANIPLAFALLGTVCIPAIGLPGFACAAVFFAGYFLRVKEAVGSIAFCFVAGLCLAGLGFGDLNGWRALLVWAGDASLQGLDIGQEASAWMAALLAEPGTWVTLAGWLVGSCVFSACCSRGSRVLACIGGGIALAVMAACTCAVTWLATAGAEGGQTAIAIGQLVPVVTGGIAAITAASFGVPDRER